MYDHKYASSTVSTYVSAIGYSHKLSGLPDPSKAFYVLQMLKGYGKIGTRMDNRLPITLPILHRIITASSQLFDSPFDTSQFQAMCLFAFYSFSRIGEITGNTHNTLQIHHISKLLDNSHNVEALKVTFSHYKHSYNQHPFSLIISRQPTFCPVQYCLNYFNLRGFTPGPLFIMPDGSPIQRAVFCNKLKTVLKLCDLDPSRYKGHSFRIGAASHAAERGLSDAQIRSMGRWKSNAFLKYIRISSVSQ